MTERAVTEHEVQFTDDDSLAVVHHEADTAKWLFFCHGLVSDKTGSYQGRAERAVAAGYNAVRFDHRGCGESDGAFVESTLSARIDDLRHVVNYFDPDSYAVFGSSFGGKVALHAADDDRIEAIATRAPVTDRRAFQDYWPVVEREGVVRLDDSRHIDEAFLTDFEDYEFSTVIEQVDVPVAIWHGARDETVSIADSFEAASKLETDVLLEKLAGEGHRFSEQAEQRMRTRLFGWL